MKLLFLFCLMSATFFIVPADDLSPLHEACRQGSSIEQIKKLCEETPSLRLQENPLNKWLPIHYAIEGGCSSEAIVYLAKEGNYFETQDRMGRTPLHLAVYYERIDIIKALLEQKVTINIQDFAGHTPWHGINSLHPDLEPIFKDYQIKNFKMKYDQGFIHNQCSICLGLLRKSDGIITWCSHQFHIQCFKQYEEHNFGKQTCPICRVKGPRVLIKRKQFFASITVISDQKHLMVLRRRGAKK